MPNKSLADSHTHTLVIPVGSATAEFNKTKKMQYWLIRRPVNYEGKEVCYRLGPVNRCPAVQSSVVASALSGPSI